MVDQPLGEAGRQHEFAVGDGDEAVAQGMEPELRPARLADARVEMLHGFEVAGRAGLGRKHPGPRLPCKPLPRGGAQGLLFRLRSVDCRSSRRLPAVPLVSECRAPYTWTGCTSRMAFRAVFSSAVSTMSPGCSYGYLQSMKTFLARDNAVLIPGRRGHSGNMPGTSGMFASIRSRVSFFRPLNSISSRA